VHGNLEAFRQSGRLAGGLRTDQDDNGAGFAQEEDFPPVSNDQTLAKMPFLRFQPISATPRT